MNIFVLSQNPREAAEQHADKHVIKMILEAVQMLYTAHWVLFYPQLLDQKSPVAVSKAQKELSPPPLLLNAPKQGYRPVHIHHPCTRWVRESIANYFWLCQLAIALAQEHLYRWETTKPHSCRAHAIWLYTHPPQLLPRAPQTPFALAMPDEYKSDDAVESYRRFYCTSKTERGITNSYTRRPRPSWLPPLLSSMSQ
jgi:hypothetical protein